MWELREGEELTAVNNLNTKRQKTQGEKHVWRKMKDFVLDIATFEISVKRPNGESKQAVRATFRTW